MLFFKCAAITLIEMVLTNSFDIENRMSLAFIIVALILVPLQCMAEEFVFRGFLMQIFGSWFNIPVLALIIQAIAFTLVHGYNSSGQIVILLSGLVYGFLAWKSNGLEVSSAMHSVNNLFAVMLEGLMIAEPSTGTISIESLIIDIITLIAIAAVIYYVGKKYDWFS